MGASGKKAKGRAKKFIDCVQQDMNNYNPQLEDAEGKHKWKNGMQGNE